MADVLHGRRCLGWADGEEGARGGEGGESVLPAVPWVVWFFFFRGERGVFGTYGEEVGLVIKWHWVGGDGGTAPTRLDGEYIYLFGGG